jgi:hypothetical protein
LTPATSQNTINSTHTKLKRGSNDDCYGGGANRPLLKCIDGGRAQLERELLTLLVARRFDRQRCNGLLRRLAGPGHPELRVVSDDMPSAPDSDSTCRPAL